MNRDPQHYVPDPLAAPAFDFYGAQNKIEKLRADEERWTKKLLAAFRRLETLREKRGRLEKRLVREQKKATPKTCGATRPRTPGDDREPQPCPLAVGHHPATAHRDGGQTWGG